MESGAKPAVIRNARKELGRLKRTPPPVDGVESAVATFYGFFAVEEPSALSQRLRHALEEDGLVLGSVSVASEGYNGALAVPVERRPSSHRLYPKRRRSSGRRKRTRSKR